MRPRLPGRAVRAVVLLMAAALGACAGFPAAAPGGRALVTGRVVLGDKPLAGVRVGAWARPDFSRSEPAAAAVTDADGYYRLTVAAGTWHVAVFDERHGWFAWSGLNPLRLAAGREAGVGFRAARMTLPDWLPGAVGAASVAARLVEDDKPLPGARIYLYLDAADDFRGPGYAFSQPADGEGRAVIEDVTPGTYWLVARKRRDDRLTGPVLEGDLTGFHPFNPLEVKAGQVLSVQIPMAAKKKELFPSAGATTVSGTVRLADGRPAAGVYVFAYTDEVVGHRKPAAASPVTGGDGVYALSLPDGGTYYLGARELYGVNPQPGERYGLYPGTPDHSLAFRRGETLTGVDIVVEEVLGWDK